MSENPFAALIFGLCLIPFILLLPFRFKSYGGLLITLIFTAASSRLAVEAFATGTIRYLVPDVPPIGSFELRIDKLSAFFMLLINLCVLAANVYALGYTRQVRHRFVSGLSAMFMCLLHISMLYVCMVEQLLAFLIAWEIMSLSSFVLILWEHRREEVREAALDYLVQMHIGVAFLTTAVLIVMRDTGTATFDSLHTYFGSHNNYLVFALFFIGFGFKAGFITLHTWMPGTYSNAPAHAGAVMASAMKKLALFGIIRVMLHTTDHQVVMGLFMLLISIATALFGIVNGIMQKNLARMLAFSSMENVGIIGIGLSMTLIGMGLHNNLLMVLGLIGALFHIFNHALFKTVLFMGAGSVRRRAHTLNMDTLGGLMHKMPKTAAVFIIASAAACGLPPLNAFISEFILYQGLLKGLTATNVSVEMLLLLGFITLVLLGGLAVFAFSQVVGVSFLGIPRSKNAENATETDAIMLWPQYVLCALILSIGLAPGFACQVLSGIAEECLPGSAKVAVTGLEPLSQVGLAGGTFIVLVAVIYYFRTRKVLINTFRVNAPWACGYLALNTRMQYTATGFSDYFTRIVSKLIGVKQTYTPIPRADIFPETRVFEVENYDTIRRNLVGAFARKLKETLNKAAIIHTGHMQSYITYACVFLVIMFALTLFNII